MKRIVLSWCKSYSDGLVMNCLGVTQECDRQTDVLVENDALNNTAWLKPDEQQTTSNIA